MDCSLSGSSVHGIFQARILEWVAISYSRDLPDPGMEPVSLMSPALAGRFFTIEPPGKHISSSLNRNDRNFYLSGIIGRIYIEHLVYNSKHSVLAVNIVD